MTTEVLLPISQIMRYISSLCGSEPEILLFTCSGSKASGLLLSLSGGVLYSFANSLANIFPLSETWIKCPFEMSLSLTTVLWTLYSCVLQFLR